jgi:hypothetical protein
MAHFSNAELAQKLSDLVDFWSSFNEEYKDWLGGTVSGGPGADGKYPLTDYTGTESLVDCPAKLSDTVGGYADLADAQIVSLPPHRLRLRRTLRRLQPLRLTSQQIAQATLRSGQSQPSRHWSAQLPVAIRLTNTLPFTGRR